MIPNSAPMAAVYLNPDATGSRDGRLFSNPVAAWDKNGRPLVIGGSGTLCRADNTRGAIELLGIWQNGWTPSYGEMSTLLPQSPEEILVTAQQLTDGTWSAFRTVNGVLLACAATLNELHDALDRHHLHCTVEKTVPLAPRGACTEGWRRPVCLPFHTDDCPYA